MPSNANLDELKLRESAYRKVMADPSMPASARQSARRALAANLHLRLEEAADGDAGEEAAS